MTDPQPESSPTAPVPGVRFATSADGFPVAQVGDSAFAMLPGRCETHFLAMAWRVRRPLHELVRNDFFGHGGVLADEEAFRAKVLEQAEHAREIHKALGGLKGPLMKVAQILSTVPDVLPEEYTQELIKLQTNAPPMGWAFVKRRMTSELGAGWQKRFDTFERDACKAASLGQVHRARSLDGRDLACKIQYPEAERQFAVDMHLFVAAARVLRPDAVHVLEELQKNFINELSYSFKAWTK